MKIECLFKALALLTAAYYVKQYIDKGKDKPSTDKKTNVPIESDHVLSQSNQIGSIQHSYNMAQYFTSRAAL